MRKVSEEIEEDVYKLVKASSLSTLIGGKVYRNGMRPFDSKSEDIVVSFLAGVDGQLQTGVLNVNAYVLDIDNGDDKLVKNTTRCKTIAIALNDFKESLMSSNLKLNRSGYTFRSDDSMITTFEELPIKQHFVNLRLRFEYLTI